MFCLIICFSLLIGCSGSGLSDDFDVDEVIRSTEDVISFINYKNSESLLEISTGVMVDPLTEDVLQEIYKGIDKGGQFLGIEDISISGEQDKESEEEFAVVVAITKYEHKRFTYTIRFTKEMMLAELHYK